MPRTALAIFFSALLFACNLNAQDVAPDPSLVDKPDVVERANETESVLDIASEQKDEEAPDDNKATVERVTASNDEGSDAAEGELDLGPAIVSVNEQGELVGQANATVNGDSVPIEASITLVSGGVLMAKTVANEDGSFSFPNVFPGDYNIYGCAASYCGGRACTVVTDSDRFERVQVQLDQTSDCGCNIGYAEAPATSFNGGGFGGGGFGSGGGIGSSYGGGGGYGGVTSGGLVGRRGFRLLAVGGIATAIALGTSDDDEVSPSE